MPPTSTTTGNDILELAYARLQDVSPQSIATESTELLLLVNRAVDGLFAVGAQVNPWFFGAVATVAFEGGQGWPRPQNAESVFRVEATDGTEVAIVPFDQREIEAGRPTIYAFGQYYRSTELDGAPTGGDLLFYFARLPIPLGSLTATVDVFWPEQFNELLGLEVAIFLAMKAELAVLDQLKGERNAWLTRYVSFLQRESGGKRGWATVRSFTPEALQLLAGGV